MNVGMGGADVSMGTVAQSIAGLDAWRVNAELWTSKEAEAHKYTSALRTLNSVGGSAESALYKELLAGKTNIVENREGAYSAKTEANGEGTKTIYLGKEAPDAGSRFGMNILLAHEAYRNGVDDGDVVQRQETNRAVTGHIGAAFALSQTYGIGAIGEEMAKEVSTYLNALKPGNDGELIKLLDSYDSSKDYWRVLKDKDGNVTKVLDDGDRENVTIVESDGTERKVKLQSGSVSGAIAAAVGNGMTQEQINKIMVSSGLDWTKEKGWYAKDESAKYTAPVAPIAEKSTLDKVSAWTTSELEQVGSWLLDTTNKISRLFRSKNETQIERTTDKYRTTAVSHLNEEYETGVNDCDIWVEKISSEAGRDISTEWGVANGNTVKDHMDLLGNKLKDIPNPGANVFFQGDGHVGYIIVNPNGSVEVYHQGWNAGDVWESQRNEYPSVAVFESAWSKKKKYWPLTE